MGWGLGQSALAGMLSLARALPKSLPTAPLPLGSYGAPWLGHSALPPNPPSSAAPNPVAGKIFRKTVEEQRLWHELLSPSPSSRAGHSPTNGCIALPCPTPPLPPHAEPTIICTQGGQATGTVTRTAEKKVLKILYLQQNYLF